MCFEMYVIYLNFTLQLIICLNLSKYCVEIVGFFRAFLTREMQRPILGLGPELELTK